MSTPNHLQGTDLASLLSMLQGVGTQAHQNGNGQQHNNVANYLTRNALGNHVQKSSANNGPDPMMLSSLLQGLTGAFGQQQQQHQSLGGAQNNLMALLAAQQLGQLNSSGHRLNGSSLGLGNSNPSSAHNQEHALALARLAGAHLLSTGDDTRTKREAPSCQMSTVETTSESPLFAHLNGLASVGTEEAARGRNLEPGAIAVPCRARGMPMDHNPLTAYFVINRNIQHGEDVICSHHACRNAGIKFRYCSFCKAPVAKRNFRRRHSHGGDSSNASSEDIGDAESTKLSTTSVSSSRRVISASETDEPASKRAKTVSSEDDDVDTTTDSSKSSHNNKRSKTVCSEDDDVDTSTESSKSVDDNKEREQENSKEEAGQELAAANTTKSVIPEAPHGPLGGEADSSLATVKSSGNPIGHERRQEWVRLLNERPVTNDQESMTKWIEKILKVSESARGQQQQASKSSSEALREQVDSNFSK